MANAFIYSSKRQEKRRNGQQTLRVRSTDIDKNAIYDWEILQGVPRAVNESLNRMGLELVPQDLLRLQESRIPRRCHGTPVAQIV